MVLGMEMFMDLEIDLTVDQVTLKDLQTQPVMVGGVDTAMVTILEVMVQEIILIN